MVGRANYGDETFATTYPPFHQQEPLNAALCDLILRINLGIEGITDQKRPERGKTVPYVPTKALWTINVSLTKVKGSSSFPRCASETKDDLSSWNKSAPRAIMTAMNFHRLRAHPVFPHKSQGRPDSGDKMILEIRVERQP